MIADSKRGHSRKAKLLICVYVKQCYVLCSISYIYGCAQVLNLRRQNINTETTIWLLVIQSKLMRKVMKKKKKSHTLYYFNAQSNAIMVRGVTLD